MARVCWPYFDPEYENFNTRMNPPRVSVDNSSCKDCTLVKVDSLNKPGILLEVVQVLTDLDLIITKAYISSDGGWFMDVFHVTDQQGNKVTDVKTIAYIEEALGPKGHTRDGLSTWPGKRVGVHSVGDHTAIELIGKDRPGLLSEISAVLANLHFNVVAAEVWTHNQRIACVLYVNDDATCRAVDDPTRLSLMKEQLKHILRGCEDDERVARTSFSMGFTHVDRRLHQMLFADRDYEGSGSGVTPEVDYPLSLKPKITIERCEEKGYSVVSVHCKDRAKLGLSLELCAKDRVGLLSEVTRILRENGLSVTRAGVTTIGEQAMNVFYVRDASGNPVDMKTIEALRKEIGHTMMLNVKKVPSSAKAPAEAKGWAKVSFFFENLLEKFLA
ncbi:ACT domain-containing protein ACR3 [Carica papaya]|uniref:ACT domain-containing protein ACR3 n=1 Tax=Carica papaya TaxID=3649 RepID=UPI000B8C7CE1|nr:ACT domain-containing protein ACR3 [Carica papaya]